MVDKNDKQGLSVVPPLGDDERRHQQLCAVLDEAEWSYGSYEETLKWRDIILENGVNVEGCNDKDIGKKEESVKNGILKEIPKMELNQRVIDRLRTFLANIQKVALAYEMARGKDINGIEDQNGIEYYDDLIKRLGFFEPYRGGVGEIKFDETGLMDLDHFKQLMAQRFMDIDERSSLVLANKVGLKARFRELADYLIHGGGGNNILAQNRESLDMALRRFGIEICRWDVTRLMAAELNNDCMVPRVLILPNEYRRDRPYFLELKSDGTPVPPEIMRLLSVFKR